MFKISHDVLFESAVTVCIILNTAFLAIEHHGMSDELKHILEIGNKVSFKYFYIQFDEHYVMGLEPN